MKRKLLGFEEINPYVRFPHLFVVEDGFPIAGRSAYDYRLMYVYDGMGCISLDNVCYDVKKGSLLIWQPGIVYGLRSGAGGSMSVIGINFDFTHEFSKISYPIPPDDIEVFKPDYITELIEFSDLAAFNKPVFIDNIHSIKPLLFEITNEFSIRKKFYNEKIRGLFLSLLGDIARYATTASSYCDVTNIKIDQIINYIHENYNKPVTNNDIGSHFNFHPVYINRLMIKHTGTSLHQYLINYRISIAINLLQNSGKSVTEIAYNVGFKDINYFSKYFKKTVGLSPKNYLTSAKCFT